MRKIVIFGGIIFFLLLLAGVIFIIRQTQPVLETPKTEMKKVPPEIRKKLDRQTNIASLSATIRVPILLYHYVEYVQDRNDKIRISLNINPNIFEQQVITLKNAGYTFITAKELGEIFDGKMRLPNNPVLLTFDDGHWDFDTVVLPILKKYQIKATAYIISGFLGGSDFMTDAQLQDVINSKLVDVGAHTVHHISLKGKLYPVVKYEVDQSKADLENKFHIHVVSFAYPDGTFDEQAIDLVKEAGFTTAVSTIPGIEQNQANRFFLYRLRPGYMIGQELLDYLQKNTFQVYP